MNTKLVIGQEVEDKDGNLLVVFAEEEKEG